MNVVNSPLMSGALSALPGLLASEPALAELLGVDPATVAVAEPARPLRPRRRSPGSLRARVLLVVTPTSAEAERLVHDLAAFVDPDDGGSHFPAWETLPFERVSPAIETMGRRLRGASSTIRRRSRLGAGASSSSPR